MNDLVDELVEWLRIPSISTGGGDPADLRRAAEWAADHVERAGGSAELVQIGDGYPLAIGDLRAATADAPTILIYGHYDVQSVGDLSAWTSPPFEPEVRDGRLYARGASDDKGNFWPLLHAACALASEGELPVNVRVVVEGEEEAGSESITEWIRADERGADAAIVFDSGMVDDADPRDHRRAARDGDGADRGAHRRPRPALRHVRRQRPQRAARPARHARPGRAAGPTARSATSCAPASSRPPRPSGSRGSACRPAARCSPRSAAARRTRARRPSTTSATAPTRRSTSTSSPAASRARSCPHVAHGAVSLRLAPGQRAADIGPELERLLREGAHPDADVSFKWHLADPSLFEPDLPALVLAAQAIERATGTAPALVRSGGSIPVVAEFAARAIPTIVSGFGLPDDDIHAPNESYRLESLELGSRTARELLISLADL